MGAGIAPEISIFLSQTPLLGESTRLVPARAEISRHVFCSRCHHSQTRQTRCWGQGRTWGSGAGTVTPRPGCSPRLLHIAYPGGSCAAKNAVLLSCLTCLALFDQYHLPSSHALLKPDEEEAGEMQCASCPPLLFPRALAVLLMKQHCCGRSCSWKKLSFLVAQWHSFQELFIRLPLCLMNQ